MFDPSISDSDFLLGIEKELGLPAQAFNSTPIPKRGKGRPATGVNSKVVRVPLDFDRELAIKMQYDWMPVIEEYLAICKSAPDSVRNEKLIKMLHELGLMR